MFSEVLLRTKAMVAKEESEDASHVKAYEWAALAMNTVQKIELLWTRAS